MLQIGLLHERTGRYYLEAPRHELPGPETATRWISTAARLLGAESPVDPNRLGAMLSGRHPLSGRCLASPGTTVSGFDCTFAAPKSVSVLMALAPEDVARSVVDAHRRAVMDAVVHLERRAVSVRRSVAGERTAQATSGLLGAGFVHATSRALDPHLHSHVVVANLVQGEDGRWGALDSRSLFAHRRAAGEIYRAALRDGLRRGCGVEWTLRSSGGWEIAGLDPVLLGAFSGRAAEIRLELFQRGQPTGRRAQWIALSTRSDKEALDRRQLSARWWSLAERAGGSRRQVAAVLERAAPGPPALDEHRFAAVVHEGTATGVTRRGAVAAWAASLARGATGAQIDACIDLLAEWGAARGAAESVRGPAEVIPPSHVVAALGPRPGTPEDLSLWRSAAADITAYRRRWAVSDRREPFGGRLDRGGLASMSTKRLVEHLELARRLEDVQRHLGRSPARAVDPQLRSLRRE